MCCPINKLDNNNAMYKIIVYTFILITGLFCSAPACYCLDLSNSPESGFVYDSKGKRDPFVPLIGQERVMSASLDTIVSPEDLKLEGIATVAGAKRIAIINGQMVKDNDKFGVLTIKSISRDHVEILLEGKDYTLTLQESEKNNADNKK